MNIVELQIMFQQKIETVNSIFRTSERPSSFVIIDYLNKAIDRFIREKYLNYPTHAEKVAAVLSDTEMLRSFIRTADGSNDITTDIDLPFNYQIRTYLPSDLMLLLSVSCTYTRSAVPAISADKVFTRFITPEQARKIVTSDADKPIYPEPLAVYEDKFGLVLAGDAYTTAITGIKIRYLREPFDLSLDYAEYIVDLYLIAVNDNYFLSLTHGTYNSITIYPGDKILKVAGEQFLVPASGWTNKFGYPYGYIDKLEFPEYVHEQIVDLAVQIFIDEAKLKLVPKQQSQKV